MYKNIKYKNTFFLNEMTLQRKQGEVYLKWGWIRQTYRERT